MKGAGQWFPLLLVCPVLLMASLFLGKTLSGSAALWGVVPAIAVFPIINLCVRRMDALLRIVVTESRIEIRRRFHRIQRIRQEDLRGVTLIYMPIDFSSRIRPTDHLRPCAVIRLGVNRHGPIELNLSPAWSDLQIDWLARVIAAVLEMELKVVTE